MPRRRGDREALRVLLATRHSACRAKVSATNQLKALIVGAPEELRAELRGLVTNHQVHRCAGLRERPARSLEHRMTVLALRSTAQRVLVLAAEADELEGEINRLVRAVAPWLLELPGMGPISAAQVLVSRSHAGRLRSEAAFAALAGVGPHPGLIRAGHPASESTGAVTASSTGRCTPSPWSGSATTPKPRPTPPAGGHRARAPERSVGASSGPSPGSCSSSCTAMTVPTSEWSAPARRAAPAPLLGN